MSLTHPRIQLSGEAGRMNHYCRALSALGACPQADYAPAHDLNLRFDFSLRNQSAYRRDLQTSLSEATSGSKAFKTSASIEYSVSKMVSLSMYYDRQRSQPLLSSSAYPTITQDFGLSMKFSLTR